MSCNFHVGQKVVCVETWVENRTHFTNVVEGPVAGKSYHVREIGYLHPSRPETVCLRLVEIVNDGMKWRDNKGQMVTWEPPFAASRFRPVVERKTDISIFKAMLNPSKQRISA